MTNKIKHRRFDQNLQPVAANGFRCCEDIFNQLQNYEAHFKIRKRARKKVYQEIFQQTVYCIISNLVISALLIKYQFGLQSKSILRFTPAPYAGPVLVHLYFLGISIRRKYHLPKFLFLKPDNDHKVINIRQA